MGDPGFRIVMFLIGFILAVVAYFMAAREESIVLGSDEVDTFIKQTVTSRPWKKLSLGNSKPQKFRLQEATISFVDGVARMNSAVISQKGFGNVQVTLQQTDGYLGTMENEVLFVPLRIAPLSGSLLGEASHNPNLEGALREEGQMFFEHFVIYDLEAHDPSRWNVYSDVTHFELSGSTVSVTVEYITLNFFSGILAALAVIFLVIGGGIFIIELLD